ncbi:2013_t:CDS:2, partial [Ambispora gerdemannii]
TRQLVANRKLTKWILHFTKPINTINDTTFEDFLNYLNLNYKLPNEKNLKLLIHQAYDWTEGSMKELLLSFTKYISLTTNLWTSRAKQGYIERLQTIQTSLNYSKILGVVCDVSTHWNSSYLVWDQLLYLKDAIDQLAIDLSRDQDSTIKKDGCCLKKINLMDDEWIFMKHLINLLGLFKEVITFLSDSIYVTLSLMHPIISELQKVFEDETLLVLSKAVDFAIDTIILDNEDEQEFVEQQENDEEEVINPITQNH